MQYGTSPNITGELSYEFMKASHVAGAAFATGQAKTHGIVRRQNRTLLTIRVFCSFRKRDWENTYMK